MTREAKKQEKISKERQICEEMIVFLREGNLSFILESGHLSILFVIVLTERGHNSFSESGTSFWTTYDSKFKPNGWVSHLDLIILHGLKLKFLQVSTFYEEFEKILPPGKSQQRLEFS